MFSPMELRYRGSILSVALFEYVLPHCQNFPVTHFCQQFLLHDPEGFVKNDGEDEIKWLMDNCNNKLRMYGSPRELADNLKVYTEFTRSRKNLNFQVIDSFVSQSIMHKNLREDAFITKQDLIASFRSMIFLDYGAMFSHELSSAMISIIFDTYEERLDGCCEYVNLDWGVNAHGKYFFAYIRQLSNKIVSDANIKKQYTLPITPMCYEEMFSYFKKLVPKWKEAEYFLMDTFSKMYSVDQNGRSFIVRAYTAVKIVAEALEETFKQFPEAFLPRSDISSPILPITIRVFEDGSDRFVIKSKLYKELNIETTEIEPKGLMETMCFDEVKKKFGNRLNGIEFILFDIKRAKHAAVPIWDPTGGHCILAADALIQFIRSLIFEQKVFQNVSGDRWSYIQKCFSDTPFKSSYKFRYFITFECFRETKKTKFHQLTIGARAELKDVRNAKKDGFTEQNLKNELTHLGLTVSFPNILDYAEEAYAEVVRKKKEAVLRTCDLFDAIENCVMISIFEKFPDLKLFLHHQKACHRITNLKCELCSPQPKPHDSDQRVDSEKEVDMKPQLCEKVYESVEKESEMATDDKASSQSQVSESNSCQKCVETKTELEMATRKQGMNEKIIELMKTEMTNLKSNIIKLNNEKTREIEQSKRLTQKNDELAKTISDLEKQFQEEKEKIEKEIKEKNTTVQDFTKQINGLNCTIYGLKSEVEKANSEKERVVREFSKRIKQLNDELNEKKKEVEKLRQEANKKPHPDKNINKNLKEEIDKKTKRITELTDSINQMSMRTGQLESLLESEKQKNKDLQKRNSQLPSEESKNQENITIINELREKNLQLTGQIEAKDMMIKSFFDRLGPSQTKQSNSSSTQTEEEDKRHGGSRFQLLGLWKIKDTFSSGIPLKLVKEVIEKMKSLSDESEVHQMANYELQHYEGEMRTYLQTVEVNIEKIKKTGECSHLLALPNHPSLSDRFINRYWDCIDEKKKKMKMEKKGKKSSNDPTDSECLFCYFEMKSNEETLACGHCRKVTHLKCASKWLRINRSCPHCRREQLDPTEFPPLS